MVLRSQQSLSKVNNNAGKTICYWSNRRIRRQWAPGHGCISTGSTAKEQSIKASSTLTEYTALKCKVRVGPFDNPPMSQRWKKLQKSLRPSYKTTTYHSIHTELVKYMYIHYNPKTNLQGNIHYTEWLLSHCMHSFNSCKYRTHWLVQL